MFALLVALLISSMSSQVADIAEGMTYLHEERIVHGDLRAVNIFLDEFGRIKISDFGLSVFSAGGSKNYFSIRAGNVRWTAPENLAPEKYRDADELLGRLALEQPPSSNEPGLRTIARPTMQSDVYAFACVCLEVHTGYAPFHNLSDHEIEACVTRPRMERAQLPPNMAQHLKDLVGRCWADNPGQRPSFANIMNELMIHTQ
ncbi:kinase-like protein [Trametopsis cervina]|nr:kinase-like protein [Trametopsis cervina]